MQARRLRASLEPGHAPARVAREGKHRRMRALRLAHQHKGFAMALDYAAVPACAAVHACADVHAPHVQLV